MKITIILISLVLITAIALVLLYQQRGFDGQLSDIEQNILKYALEGNLEALKSQFDPDIHLEIQTL